MRSSARRGALLGFGLGGRETVAVARRLGFGELGGVLGRRHRLAALGDGEVVVEHEFGRRPHARVQ